MKSNQEMIEYLHNIGKMSDNMYYQLNGKSFNENYIDIMRKRHKADMSKQKELAEIEKKAEEAIEKAVNDAFEKLFK